MVTHKRKVPLCKRADVGVKGRNTGNTRGAELTNKIKVNCVINLFVSSASVLFTFQGGGDL